MWAIYWISWGNYIRYYSYSVTVIWVKLQISNIFGNIYIQPCSHYCACGCTFRFRGLILRIMMTSSNGNIVRVTGHLCGEFTDPQSWAEYSSRPSEMRSICEQPFYGIILMILHMNKSCVLISNQNLQIFLNPLKKIPMLRDIRTAFSLPAMTQPTFTGPARVEWSWVNDFSHND